MRELGYPAAFVAQDGLEHLEVPWHDFDVFVGGSTAWKLGQPPPNLTRRALAWGKTVHMGRVNSARRFRYARSLGCESVGGTFLAYAPDINLRRLRSWIDATRSMSRP
jgi:hypothetical protein